MDERTKAEVEQITDMIDIYRSSLNEADAETIKLMQADLTKKQQQLSQIKEKLDEELSTLYNNGANEIDPEINQLQREIQEIDNGLESIADLAIMDFAVSQKENEVEQEVEQLEDFVPEIENPEDVEEPIFDDVSETIEVSTEEKVDEEVIEEKETWEEIPPLEEDDVEVAIEEVEEIEESNLEPSEMEKEELDEQLDAEEKNTNSSIIVDDIEITFADGVVEAGLETQEDLNKIEDIKVEELEDEKISQEDLQPEIEEINIEEQEISQFGPLADCFIEEETFKNMILDIREAPEYKQAAEEIINNRPNSIEVAMEKSITAKEVVERNCEKAFSEIKEENAQEKDIDEQQIYKYDKGERER